MSDQAERRRAWDGYVAGQRLDKLKVVGGGSIAPPTAASVIAEMADAILAERDRRFPPPPTQTGEERAEKAEGFWSAADVRNAFTDGIAFGRKHPTGDSRQLGTTARDHGQAGSTPRATGGEEVAHPQVSLRDRERFRDEGREFERLRIAALVLQQADYEDSPDITPRNAGMALRDFARHLREQE